MSDQINSADRFSYYDRDADIVWLPTSLSTDFRDERQDWGVVSRDSKTGAVVSIEIWAASEVLPPAVLDALPEPADPDA